MSEKIFDASGWFAINNAVFDVIMPNLSPNAFKVLCVAIRQTWGWTDGDGGRKQTDKISYSQFQKKAGIGSYSTVSRAVMECLNAGYLIRHQVGRHPGTGKPIFAYSLNTDYELATTTETVVGPTTESVAAATTETVVAEAPTTKTVAGPTTESVAAVTTETVVAEAPTTKTVAGATTVSVAGATTETVVTKTKRKQTSNDDDVNNNKTNALTALINLGVAHKIASELVETNDPERVLTIAEHARDNGDNPAGLAVWMLKNDGVIPAKRDKSRSREADRRRYLEWAGGEK